MQIQLSEIPEEGLELQVDDISWFPSDDIRRTGDLSARVMLERRQGSLVGSGSIDLTFVLDCDRCLQEYQAAKRITFSVSLEREEDAEVPDVKEHQCDKNEMDVVLYKGNVLDIGSILEQQVLLAYPLKRLCKDSCPGICSECGLNLNNGSCLCSEKSAESPFSILSQLINK